MTAINKRAIRHALEAPLRAALVSAGVCVLPLDATKAAVQFGNTVLDTVALNLQEYIRFTVHYGRQRVIEMGNTPRRHLSGIAKAMVYTKGQSEDRNDTIAGIVEAAYPYNAVLTVSGVSVILAVTEIADGAPDGPWWAAPVNINWDVWRQV